MRKALTAVLMLLTVALHAQSVFDTPYVSFRVEPDSSFQKAFLTEEMTKTDTVFFVVTHVSRTGLTPYYRLDVYFGERSRILWWDRNITEQNGNVVFLNENGRPSLVVKRIP